MTYRQMAELSARAAWWIDARDIEPGARIALLAENDGTWCGAYLGILRAGAVAVPLDTNYTPAQVAKLLKDCGASAVFTSDRFIANARAALELYQELPLVRMHADFTGLPAAPLVGTRPVRADDPAVILYTSGTTADPKGVVLTHANIVAERTSAFERVHVDERDAILSVLPLFHALAQMANLLLPFSVGARVVFLEQLNTTELTRALRERGITAFVCVPQFFYLLHQRIEQEVRALPWPARLFVRGAAAVNIGVRRALHINPGRVLFRRIHRSLGPNLRILITGGARFDPEVNRALYALGFSIQQAYGLTETSGGATVTLAGDPHLASVGPPLSGVDVRIAPPGNADHGEVLIRGGIVMKGYYHRPEQNAVTLEGGWLHTGDLGYLDAHGRLYITGRSKEMIVLGSGKNIYPEEIEAHYEKSPFIQELCVVGISRPGEPTSERLHALIRPDAEAMRARGAINIRELLRFEVESLSVQLPAHKRILGYEVTLDPLPRTTTRKLKRFEIQKQIETQSKQRHGESAEIATWPDDPATRRILELMREQVRGDVALTPGAHLELDLGLDSMERVELLVHLSGALQIQIVEEDSQQLHTAGDLVEACRSRLRDGWETGARVQAWERLLQETPADDRVLRELQKPKRLRAFVLFPVVKVLSALFAVTAGLRTRGIGYLPKTGPYLISPNHQSYLDAFMVVGALPFRSFKDMFFVGAAEYFQTPFMAWLARTLNVVPVDPDANLVGAMQAGAYGLRLGKVLVLFPEGERSIDGDVKAFRKGAAILSRHLGAPIVPVAIDGAWDIWARGRSLNWRALLPWSRTRARVEFGPPLAAPTDDDYVTVTSVLRDRVVAIWQRIHAGRVSSSGLAAPRV